VVIKRVSLWCLIYLVIMPAAGGAGTRAAIQIAKEAAIGFGGK
jgi:hypothetical protein